MSINNIQELNVGLNGAVGFKPIVMKQFDKNTRRIEITLLEGSDIYEIPVGAVAKFQATKPDGTIVFDDCGIENGVVVYKAAEQLSTYPGIVKCEIGIYESDANGDTSKDGLLQSTTFNISVEESAMDRNAVASSSEFNTLTIMINTITGLVERAENTIEEINIAISNTETAIANTEIAINNAEQATSEAQQATATINATNQTVINNENTRIETENTRKSNEITRQSQETARQTNTTAAITRADTATTRANLAAKSCEDIASGIIQLPDIGTVGTYTKVTTDIKGRVISGSTPTAIADLGITNVYTKTEIDTKTNDINTSLANQIATASGASINLPNSFSGGLLFKELQGKSVQNGVPSPDSKVDMVSVGDNGSVVARITGKNVLLKTTTNTVTKNGITITFNGEYFIVNGTPTTTTGYTRFEEFLRFYAIKGKTYTNSVETKVSGIGVSVGALSNGGVAMDLTMADTVNNKNGTITSDTAIAIVYINVDNTKTYNNNNQKIMIELGSTSTTYEPYKEQLVTIPLTQPLRSVGSVYDRGCVKKDGLWGNGRKFASVVLDGSSDEKWARMPTNTAGIYRFKCAKVESLIKRVQTYNDIANMLCDTYKTLSARDTFAKTTSISCETNGELFIFDSAYETSELATFTSKLASNPITVIYELATSTFEPYSQSLQDQLNKLQTYQGITNVFTTDALQPTLSVSYGKTDTSALSLYASNMNDNKLDKISVANNLITNVSGTVLGGEQGKILNDKIGNLSDLTTTSKTDLVGSVNEVKASVDVVNNNLTTLSTSLTDEWHNVLESANFIAYNNASRLARYKKIGSRISIEGAISPSAVISNSSALTLAFTLPVGYRPSTDRVFLCQGSVKNTWLLTVQASGDVTVSRYGTTEFTTIPTTAWLPFDISFEI